DHGGQTRGQPVSLRLEVDELICRNIFLWSRLCERRAADQHRCGNDSACFHDYPPALRGFLNVTPKYAAMQPKTIFRRSVWYRRGTPEWCRSTFLCAPPLRQDGGYR